MQGIQRYWQFCFKSWLVGVQNHMVIMLYNFHTSDLHIVFVFSKASQYKMCSKNKTKPLTGHTKISLALICISYVTMIKSYA